MLLLVFCCFVVFAVARDGVSALGQFGASGGAPFNFWTKTLVTRWRIKLPPLTLGGDMVGSF